YELIEQDLSLLELEMGQNGFFWVRTRYGFKTFLLLILGLYSDLRDLLLLPWPDLELHLSGDVFLSCDLNGLHVSAIYRG
ncbi:hypothetical protein Tco_1357213, partial [Tanacetum coccineum]